MPRVCTRPTVEGCRSLELSIDHITRPIDRRRRKGIPPPRARRLRWAEPRAVVDVALLLDQAPAVAVLRFDVAHAGCPTGLQVQRVELVPVPLRGGFGGARWHWVCPGTGRAIRKLYLPDGATRFMGWRALGLGWRTTRVTPLDRSHLRFAKLARRLDAEYRGFTPAPPPKPPGMRQRVYDQVVAAWAAAVARHDAIWAGRAQARARPRRAAGG